MGNPLYIIAVRAGKDRDAVKAALERFYSGWPVSVVSLGGSRDTDKLLEELSLLLKEYRNSYILLLVGREDSALLEVAARSIVDERFGVTLVPKKRVRNARLEEIQWSIERARATLRLRVGVRSGKLVPHRVAKSEVLPMLEVEQPYADVFLATRGWVKWLERLGCRGLSQPVVLERLAGGVHLVYSQGAPICKLHIPDEGTPRAAPLPETLAAQEAREWDWRLVEQVAETLEHISRRILEEAVRLAEEQGGYDAIVVPWSGGKDSTVALYLAKKYYGDVVAVYIDTGVDFPQTKEYVRSMAEELGVELIEARAPVREELRHREPPTHSNRWCTGLKLESLEAVINKLGERVIVVTGDRDAESEARSRRPPIRIEHSDSQERIVVTPLKQWSTLMLQLYARVRGLHLNPLYDAGFYRLGCYMCPAFRGWEKMLAEKEPLVAAALLGRPFYRLWRRALRQG